MKKRTATHRPPALGFLCAAILAALAIADGALAALVPPALHVPVACSPLSSAGQIPAPTVIGFDDLPDGANIGNHYQAGYGMTFEDSRTARVMATAVRNARSAPNVARSEVVSPNDPAMIPLNFSFTAAKSHVGMFLGNGGGATTARLEGFDADGNQICTANATNVPDGHTAFIGFRDDAGRIVSVALTYTSAQAESIDDLHFSLVAAPTATPTATATRPATSTPTRAPTSTPTRPNSPAAALFVFPVAVAPGGEPAVSGYGFPALADLRLILSCPGSRTEFDLGAARADAAGRLRTTVAILTYPPNPCLLAARQGTTTLAETALTVLPALELSFSPQGGPPGTMVSFTVHNLVAGELRLDYAGRAVFGPAAVAAGAFSGAFIVPGDRPDPMGAVVAIRAANLILGRTAAAAMGTFTSQAGRTPPVYRVVDLQLPGTTSQAGSDFTLRGRISPAPEGPLSQFQVIPIWQKADGRTFPIGRGRTQIGADGGFSAPARVPSLLTGDPTWPETGDHVGVILITATDKPQPFLQTIADPPMFPKFNVKVVDAQTQQLISAAKISLQVWDYQVSAGSLGQVAGQAMTGVSNQVGQVLGTTELTDDEKAWIALTKAMCIPIGIPVNGNKWELINPTLDQTLSEPSVQGLLQGNSIIVETAGAASLSPAGDAAVTAGEVIPYLLTVDALDAGYGLKDADGTVKNLSQRVNFHLADLTYRDLKGNVLPNPYTVALAKLSSADQSALGPIGVFMAGIGAPTMTGPTAVPCFDRYYSTKNAPAGVQVIKAAEGAVHVNLSYAQFHKLGPGGMKLYLDGALVADFNLQFNPGLICDKFKGTQPKSAPFYHGKAVIPNAHLLAPGARSLLVRAQLIGGQWVSYNHILQVDLVPASWFAIPAVGTRTLTWRPGEVDLFTPWLSPAANTELLTSGAETKETGPLDNRTVPTNNFSQRAEANGHKGAQTAGQLAGQALNRDGKGCNLSYCPPNATAASASPAEMLHAASRQQPAANPVASHSYGPHKEEVVPTITFDLPEAKYGIPFVAEVAAGGSVSYGASVTYGGATTILDDGAVQSKLTIHPEASSSGTVYVEGRLLSGLIGKAGASLTANFDLHMPVTYDTAQSKPLTAGTYFAYGADFKAWHKWGCVPGLGCAYSKTYPKHLFDGCQQLTGSTGCSAATSAQAAVIAAVGEPPQFDLQLAASGQGALMAIWPASLTSLTTSVFDGVTWSAAGAIATGVGNSQPQVAFLAPDRAIAVWTETNPSTSSGQALTEAQLPGLTGEELLRAQRIAYALWDGASWSAAQPLTVPSLGEGGVALTACPAWQPGCPAGGAAVAVWERNLAANFDARQIRLTYATYQTGVWTAPGPVDEASTFTDILPQVAYVNGAPLVAWVRDSDTDLTDASSRRIALRFLNGDAVFTPVELPTGIAEVALGVDGAGQPVLAFTLAEDPGKLLTNRRPLWVASVTCTGPTICIWQPRKLTDAAGRSLYAERPLLTTDAAGNVAVTFRGMGFGSGTNVQPGDPPGMTSGQGELAHAALNFATGQVAPKYLTQDDAVNWLPAAAYDPLLGVSLATAIKNVPQAGSLHYDSQASGLRYSPAPDLPVAAAVAPTLPDFVLADAALTGGPATGGPLRAVVRVMNIGAPWPGSAELPLETAAAWDGAPGLGVPAGQIAMTSLDATPFVTVTFDLTPPPAGLDAPHALHLAVNPGLPIPEADASNNNRTLPAGGLLPPLGLWAQIQRDSTLIFLGWEAAADRRVAGYRVYRAGGDGVWQPVGSSFAPGYVDLTAGAASGYRYAVAAYTAGGQESSLSQGVNVGVPGLRTYLPLVTRGSGPS